MGVISTGSIFKTLTFDGRSSSEFNVYITGEGVFNAPERAVEMISIPGRNGAFALDYGRFENIEITYNCGIAGDDDADFASAISDFRNWLCSRNGYVRLSDDYNAGEYRMAVYKSGLEVTAENLKAGEFPVVFECKPQRFLTSGEDTISVTSGDTITNSTLFDARPLLEITGYGNINLGNNTITFDGQDIGDIIIAGSTYAIGPYNATTSTATKTITVDASLLRAGDAFTVTTKSTFYLRTQNGGQTIITEPISRHLFEASFAKGTSSTQTDSVSGAYSAAISIAYNGNNAVTITNVCTMTAHANTSTQAIIEMSNISAYSTMPSDTSNVYIDLDIGEAWTEIGGEIASLNNRVTMPAELPTLTPGANTITFDNTITQFDIVPRWWKI